MSSLHAKAATRETPPLPTTCGQKRKPGLLRRSAEHAPDPRETPKAQRNKMITVRCPRRRCRRVRLAPPTRSASAVPRLLEECREERAWLSGASTSGARRTHSGNWGFPQWGKRWAMRALLVKRGFENAQEISYGASGQLIKCRALIVYDLAVILKSGCVAPERRRNRCSF